MEYSPRACIHSERRDDEERREDDEVGEERSGKREMGKFKGILPAFIRSKRGSVVSTNKATKHP